MVGSGTTAAAAAAAAATAAAATCRMPIAKTEDSRQKTDRNPRMGSWNRTGAFPVAHHGRLASVRALRGLALPCPPRLCSL
jgi:hypothetical protein